jgi:ABC-type multidrug transport system permease subunit
MLLEIILYTQIELVLIFLAVTFFAITYVMGEFSFKKKNDSRKRQYQTYLELSKSCVNKDTLVERRVTRKKAA